MFCDLFCFTGIPLLFVATVLGVHNNKLLEIGDRESKV